jgi:hypothetical protein
VDWSSLYPNEVILHGPRNRKEIGLLMMVRTTTGRHELPRCSVSTASRLRLC